MSYPAQAEGLVNMLKSFTMWHNVGGPLSRRSFCLFWRETKGLSLQSSTWPEVGKGTRVRSWTKELRGGVGNRRRRVAVGSRHRTAEETSQHEIGFSSSEGKPVKMSQHATWFVEISLEIHTSVSLQGMQCHNLTYLHLSWPKPYCSFVLCSFLPLPWLYFLCRKEMCDTPIGTTRWFTGQEVKWFKEVDVSGGRGGIVTSIVFAFHFLLILLEKVWIHFFSPSYW